MITWNDKAAKAAVAAAIDRASEKGAKMVYRAAKGTQDFQNDTGALRKSIKMAKSKFSDGGWVVYTDEAEAPHAHLVELGCRNGAQPPQPFMRNAKKSREAAIKQLFRREVGKI